MSGLLSAIDAMAATDAHALPSPVLLVGAEELIEARDRIDALLARHLQAMDVTDVTVNECGRATRSWLVEEMRRSPTDARRMLAAARGMPAYPGLAAAFTAGDISSEHVRVILGCLRLLPTGAAETDADLDILLAAARSMDPVSLGAVVREILLRTGAEESREAAEQRRYADRWAAVSTTVFGMVHVEALLDPESGHTLLAAVEAMMSPPYHDSADEEPRTVGQRRADAIIELARYSLAGGRLPDNGGDRPQVIVTIPYDTLSARISDPAHLGSLNGPLGPVPITPDTARRLACDADIIPAVLGSDGTVLDLGRAQRSWSAAQRRAARLRDGGCVFPRCQAALDTCDLHHLRHWAHGGPTDHDKSLPC